MAAARAADPAVIIVDPLAAGWRYAHVRDGLHPTAAGSAWIAGRVAAVLREYGVRAAPVSAGRGAIICDPATARLRPGYGADRARAASGFRGASGSRAGRRKRSSVPPPAADSAWTVPP